MEMTWQVKVRIGAAFAVGALLIGVAVFGMVAGGDLQRPVLAANLGLDEVLVLAAAAMVSGFAAYLFSRPYGWDIGVLAVPAGLAVLAARSGVVATLFQQRPGAEFRADMFSSLRLGAVFWLAIVAAGFLGVALGQMAAEKKDLRRQVLDFWGKKESRSKLINGLLAMAVTVIIAPFGVKVFVQDVELGALVGQPAKGQIAFGVLAAFALSGFLVKKFLRVHYIWPILASGLVTGVVNRFYLKDPVVKELAADWPANCFMHPGSAVAPIAMVGFGCLGAIIGYWAAVRFEYWRQHESG